MLRERLTLVLLALLPLHAFLVTLGTKLIVGPGNAPLSSLAIWKEVVLLLVLILAFVEWVRKPSWKLDWLDGIILSLLMLGVVVTALTHADLQMFVYGMRYDFVPLIAFVVLRRVEWSQWFRATVWRVVLATGSVVALYGILTAWLPQSFFTWLGYSDLHSLYNSDGPVAAYQQIGGTWLRRIQSTMSGPNQLGLWLLLPLSVALVRKRFDVALFASVAIVLTFSRSAWIAAALIVSIMMWRTLSRKVFYSAVAAVFAAAFMAAVVLHQYSSDVILRKASTSDHITRPLAAISEIVQHPFGQGLGTAGPASNRVSDTCAFYEAGADTSWVPADSALCVFAGEEQVHPVGKTCQCPNLPENWYLQIGVEMGVLGMLLFVALITVLLIRLFVMSKQRSNEATVLPLVLALLGISLAALFLHAWESSAVAYSLWIMIAATSSRLNQVTDE